MIRLPGTRGGTTHPNTEKDLLLEENRASFEELFREMYGFMMRYAAANLKGCRDPAYGDSEDAVMTTFLAAWVNRQKLFASPNPRGWLVEALKRTILKMRRLDARWKKFLAELYIKMDEWDSAEDLFMVQFEGIVTDENLRLLVDYVLNGYTNSDLCEKYHMKKSAVTMRLLRTRERLMKEWEK